MEYSWRGGGRGALLWCRSAGGFIWLTKHCNSCMWQEIHDCYARHCGSSIHSHLQWPPEAPLRLLSVLTSFGFLYLMTGGPNSLSPTSELLTCHWLYAPSHVSAVQHTNPIWILHLPVIVFASLHLSAAWQTNSRTLMCLFAMLWLLQVPSYTITALRGRLMMFCVIAGQLVQAAIGTEW
jgi:hypothetical protein